jgi:hypothetical protein
MIGRVQFICKRRKQRILETDAKGIGKNVNGIRRRSRIKVG